MNPAPLNTDAPFTEGDIARFNRFTHFPKDRDRENARFAEQSRQERTQAKQILKGHGKTEMPEDVERALERLRKARYQVFMASVRSREIAPPWSVVGPARYAEHANPDRAHRMMGRAFEELNNARAALARRLNQHGPSPVIRSDNATAVQLLEARIAAAQRHQEKMKRANAILRDQGTDESWKISRLEAGVTGMRARELVDLNICHVRFMRPFTVTILGKGRKERVCPLWRETMDALRDCLGPRAARPTEATPLFLNVHGARLTRFGVRYIVADREGAAARAHPSLQTRRVPRIPGATPQRCISSSPMRSGDDSLLAWASSIETTNTFVEIDLEMKRKTLQSCERLIPRPAKPAVSWQSQSDALAWLATL